MPRSLRGGAGGATATQNCIRVIPRNLRQYNRVIARNKPKPKSPRTRTIGSIGLILRCLILTLLLGILVAISSLVLSSLPLSIIPSRWRLRRRGHLARGKAWAKPDGERGTNARRETAASPPGERRLEERVLRIKRHAFGGFPRRPNFPPGGRKALLSGFFTIHVRSGGEDVEQSFPYDWGGSFGIDNVFKVFKEFARGGLHCMWVCF